ncbi:MAG: histidine--tRNA ligase [bacterium]
MRRPKGTSDIFGDDIYNWSFLENKIKEACCLFGIDEMRTPIFEFKELFERGVGETTDVVQKEMFCFNDRGNREYALKPEGTAGTVRAYLENKLSTDVQPTKLFYIAPSFRDERNQAGRFKQFHQFGVEVFGSFEASADAEVISFMSYLLNSLGVKGVILKLNSLGDNDCRKDYNVKLKGFLESKIECLCNDCNQRYEKNPLRVLDCKNPNCKEAIINAPTTIDSLDDECAEHFNKLKNYLDIMGIKYEIDTNIVRGLDYYTKTVFEFVCQSDKLGSQSTICGGGRYDNLIKQYGGAKTGAVGFGMGMERLLIIMQEQGLLENKKERPLIYIGSMGEAGAIKAQEIAFNLRSCNKVYVEYDIVKRSVKAQLKYADKINARYVVIIGDNELAEDSVNLKNMDESSQEKIALSSLEQLILFRR